MNRRNFILSAGVTFAAAMTAGRCRLLAQKESILAGARQYSVGDISCIIQPDSVIFLRNNYPILAYRTTFRENGDESQTGRQTNRGSLVPFPCFTRLSSPTSLAPLSPLRMSAAAAFVCDNIDGVNYTIKKTKKNDVLCGQILSNGLKWKGMSEIVSDDATSKLASINDGVESVFEDECKWVNSDGRVQMTDTRRFRVVFFDKSRYGVYVTIDWNAVDAVKISANRNCLFGVQASLRCRLPGVER